VGQTVDIIVGIQWGDEGKGRVVDLYAKGYDIIARFGGGDNAGHSIEVGEQKLALRIVPSGVLQQKTKLFIGSGAVISLTGITEELSKLQALGIDTARIAISDRAHIVFPYHAALDRLSEAQRGDAKIGTTGRGIGPTYVDKAGRLGITFGDLARPEALANKLRMALMARAPLFSGAETLPREEDLISEALAFAKTIGPHVVDGVAYVHDALERGESILAEGAQGTLLDVGFGTYPYVTSSHTIAGGACTGLGIGPTAVRKTIGIAKAYCTRVGGGPFPSELHGAAGERLRSAGKEFGVVTGRPRRCGWFDAVAGRYAAQINGLTEVVITKLDVLSGFDQLKIVRGYRRGGVPLGFGAVDDRPLELEIETLPGWQEDIRDIRHIRDLPANAQAYVRLLGETIGVPVSAVSVGPERSAFAT
jgi:adenylosuccinate synthase